MNTNKEFSEFDFLLFMEANYEDIKYLYMNMPHKDKISFSRFCNFVYKCS